MAAAMAAAQTEAPTVVARSEEAAEVARAPALWVRAVVVGGGQGRWEETMVDWVEGALESAKVEVEMEKEVETGRAEAETATAVRD